MKKKITLIAIFIGVVVLLLYLMVNNYQSAQNQSKVSLAETKLVISSVSTVSDKQQAIALLKSVPGVKGVDYDMNTKNIFSEIYCK